jgi:hypothetical protein
MNITNYLEEHYPHDLDKILLADGFEEAFMGVVESFDTAPKACYNYDGCITILMEGDVMNGEPWLPAERMTYDEAVEYLEFNVTQAYVGEHTPAFLMNVALGEQKI